MSDRDDYEYGRGIKKFVVYITDHVHAKMLAKMDYDGIKQAPFIKAILEGYADDNEHIRAFVNSTDKFKITKHTRQHNAREKRKIALQEYSLNLDQAELDEIFDILEDDDD